MRSAIRARILLAAGLLAGAAAVGDADNGAHFAEQLANLEADINDNHVQLQGLEELYKQNTQIIAQSIREVQKFQQEFEQVKVRVAVGRSLENLATLMKGSITELQGMMGGELSQSMQQLRQSAAGGEGQMRATIDLAKEMGSSIQRQQDMRKARGAQLFEEYKRKMGMVQAEAGAAPAAAEAPKDNRQKIAEK